ncbi:MAG: alpha-L-arabinofuranosidase C-terminal domain-containing protein, partial [Anaerolineales bacterium]
IDRQIEQMDAACRFVQAKRRSKKRSYLCFDEWNVWYKNMQMDGEGKFAPHLIEEVYNLEDALVVAGFLHSFVRHADVVKIANLAQIVNVIAPVMTKGDDVLVQSIFHPFEMFSKRHNGVSLRCSADGPGYEGKTNGFVYYVDSSAILAGDRLHVFLTNRSLDEAAEVRIALTGREIVSLESAEALTGPGPKSANSFEDKTLVIAKPFEAVDVVDGQAYCQLPPLSFAAITLKLS